MATTVIPMLSSPQTQYSIQEPTQGENPNFPKTSLLCCGITQLIGGFICMILGGVGIAIGAGRIGAGRMYYYGYDGNDSSVYYFAVSFIGTGIWTGFLMMVAGALGIASGKTYGRCPTGCSIAMCVFTIMAGMVYIGMALWALTMDAYFSSSSTSRGSRVTLDSLEVTMAFIMFVVASVQAALSCRACNTFGENDRTQLIIVQAPRY